MKYKLIKENWLNIESKVNLMLAEGWELYGQTMSHIRPTGETVILQPMVKKNEKVKRQTVTLAFQPKDVVECWNRVFAGTNVRQKLVMGETLRKRLQHLSINEFNTIEAWSEYFTQLTKSEFLMGNIQVGDRKPFQLCIEWAVKESNMIKIVEGAYHNG